MSMTHVHTVLIHDMDDLGNRTDLLNGLVEAALVKSVAGLPYFLEQWCRWADNL